MEFKWAKSFAKVILYAALIAIVFNAGLAAYLYFQASQIVDARLGDLAMIVAEENCLSKEFAGKGTNADSFSIYEGLLGQSETSSIRFSTPDPKNMVLGNIAPKGKADMNYAVSVLSGDGKGNYNKPAYSYDSAPQRGRPLQITVRAKAYVPMLLMGSWASPIPMEISKSYIVVGTRFYKQKG
ncbi:MAG: hypothetical protein RSC68_03260 [Acinetobacter sp.]